VPDLKRILLVEDSKKDVELTLAALDQYHLANEVVVARDGAEALDYLWRRGKYRSRADECPAVVLLDLKLPKVDGLQVLREVKGDPRTKTIPVIVLTSSTENGDLSEGYRLGVNSYVQKPVDFDQFRETIKTMELYWLMINQPPPERAIGAN